MHGRIARGGAFIPMADHFVLGEGDAPLHRQIAQTAAKASELLR